MKNILTSILIGAIVTGCSLTAPDRLYFVEKNHMGLKVEIEPQSETPGLVNFGYKRKMATLIPCRAIDKDGKFCELDSAGENELLSVISVFNTRVTWFSGTSVHTYFATGKAAEQTAQNLEAIKKLAKLRTP